MTTPIANSTQSPTAAGKRVLALLLSVVVLAAAWLVALPWLASRPRVNARLQWLSAHQIDPSAMYYTELEAMEPILERLNRQERGGLPQNAPNAR